MLHIASHSFGQESSAMKKLSLALATAFLFVGQSQASIVLEFFQGTSVNDTTLSLTPFPNDTVTLVPGGALQFWQGALHQTPPRNILDDNNGLVTFNFLAVYGPGQTGNWVVPATFPGGAGTVPVCGIANPAYTLGRAYRTGTYGNMPGGNETT